MITQRLRLDRLLELAEFVFGAVRIGGGVRGYAGTRGRDIVYGSLLAEILGLPQASVL